MQLAQIAGAPYQQAAPYHWTDPEQPDLDLHNLATVGVSYRRGSFNDWFGRLRRSRLLISLRSIAPRCRGHPTLPDALLLTGTDRDRPLERWWGLGGERRRAVIRAARSAGVVMATTPNFSLFVDRPRWDDLHAMMRIALVHWEFMEEGLPAALHINGRTETDFARWATYLASRPEITHVAYEFGTGTGWAGRREQHAAWLVGVALSVGRPLALVVRGGTDMLPLLASAYASVTVLETSVFMKTVMRQRAVSTGAGTRLTWQASPTPLGAPIDGLWADNWAAVETGLARAGSAPRGKLVDVRPE